MPAMRPKSDMDKQLRRVAQIKLENAGPEVVEYLVDVVNSDQEATRDRLRAAEMILSRLLPTLQSMDIRALIAEFGLGRLGASPASDKFSEDRRAAVLHLIDTARGRAEGGNGA